MRLTAVTLLSVVLCGLALFTAVPASAGTDIPLACDRFRTGMVQRDAGTAVDIWVDHQCWFADPLDVTIETRENGQVRDRVVLTGQRKLEGRTVRRVELADKPLCTWSVVEVEAYYHYLAIGDDYTSRRTIWYDPNDNCDA